MPINVHSRDVTGSIPAISRHPEMQFTLVSLLSLFVAVNGLQNGEVIGTCTTNGDISCYAGTLGFITCTNGAIVYRDCGPGTVCAEGANGPYCKTGCNIQVSISQIPVVTE